MQPFITTNVVYLTMKTTYIYSIVFLYAVSVMSCSPTASNVQSPPETPEAPTTLPSTNSDLCTDNELAQIESDIKNALAVYDTDADFSLKVVSQDNRVFEFNRGTATQSKMYESASSSKWVTATIILHYMQSSTNTSSAKPLTLDSKPQEFISNWPILATDSLYNMTLRDLMSFTSGFTEEANCLNSPTANFENCVITMAAANAGNGYSPGQTYFYSGVHLQVAGLMAIKARDFAKGLTTTTWQNIFSDFKAATGTFLNSSYDLPSATNPRLAGGMHWIGNDYVDFLKRYSKGEIINPNLMSAQLSDQVGSAFVEASPARRGTGEEWHYGLGLWAECHSPTYNCGNNIETFSSAGAYGAYPFYNVKHGFVGLVARQGGLGTGMLGYYTYASVADKVTKWATKSCAE